MGQGQLTTTPKKSGIKKGLVPDSIGLADTISPLISGSMGGDFPDVESDRGGIQDQGTDHNTHFHSLRKALLLCFTRALAEGATAKGTTFLRTCTTTRSSQGSSALLGDVSLRRRRGTLGEVHGSLSKQLA